MEAYKEQGLAVEVTRYFMGYQFEEGEGVVVVLNDYDFSVEFKEGFIKRPEPESSPRPKSSKTNPRRTVSATGGRRRRSPGRCMRKRAKTSDFVSSLTSWRF